MIDTSKQYTYNGKPVRIYADGSDTAHGYLHCAVNDDGWKIATLTEDQLVEVWEPKEGTPAWLGLQLVLIYEVSDKGIYIKTEEDSFYTSICHLREFTGTLPEAFKGL